MPGSHLRFVRTLDFGVSHGLGARAAAEISSSQVSQVSCDLSPRKGTIGHDCDPSRSIYGLGSDHQV